MLKAQEDDNSVSLKKDSHLEGCIECIYMQKLSFEGINDHMVCLAPF